MKPEPLKGKLVKLPNSDFRICGEIELKSALEWLKKELFKIADNCTDKEQKEIYEIAIGECLGLLDEAFEDVKC